MRLLLSVTLILFLVPWASAAPIVRVLPPVGVELPPGKKAELADELSKLKMRLATTPAHRLTPDIEVFAKAVDYALRFGEFYNEKDISKDVAKAVAALQRANERLDQLAAGQTPWTSQRGLLVRGFRSRVDGSPQPYGLVIPEKLDLTKPVPLYVWLHGRGDKQTDLHFIADREKSAGQVAPPNAITVHPFGRQCVGFKSAGETDVLEAIAAVAENYNVDPQRIVMAGFSMGGAGAWHLGAHYADRWAVVQPGAGFAETAQYNRLQPATYPPWYEQILWGCYDVPGYTRNLFNVPVIAYSGEKDKQIQAAQIMEAAFAEHGQKLRHLIGPDTEHKFHPETLKELLSQLDQVVQTGRNPRPTKVSLQTRTLRYSRMFWVEAVGLVEHWKDSRIDAELTAATSVSLSTTNISALQLYDLPPGDVTLTIDKQTLVVPGKDRIASAPLRLVRNESQWTYERPATAVRSSLAKLPKLQGPIDDAFLDPFLVVLPSEKSKRPLVQAWVEAELNHFQDRWRSVMRGDLRMKRDTEVTTDDIAQYHLVLWGDPDSNQLVRKIHGQLPVNWPNGSVQVEDVRFPADSHVPVLIYPNPLNRGKYVVLNSGPTFREAHDKTNSQQNPKLPDWAVIDINHPPDAAAPGRIANAGFFDERWQVKTGK